MTIQLGACVAIEILVDSSLTFILYTLFVAGQTYILPWRLVLLAGNREPRDLSPYLLTGESLQS